MKNLFAIFLLLSISTMSFARTWEDAFDAANSISACEKTQSRMENNCDLNSVVNKNGRMYYDDIRANSCKEMAKEYRDTCVERIQNAETDNSGAGGMGTSGSSSLGGAAIGNNDCHCIEVWADSSGEYLKNICDYKVAAPICVVGHSCSSDKSSSNSFGGGGLNARGSQGQERDTTGWDTIRVQNSSKTGKRLPWGYGAIALDKHSKTLSWENAKARGWICSENRPPAILPEPKPYRNAIKIQ